MATPGLTREQAEDVIGRVETKLREGFRPQGMTGSGQGAVIAAAEQAVKDGICHTPNAFVSRVRMVRLRFGLEPDESAYRPLQYLHRPPGLPVIPSQDHIQEGEPEGEPDTMAVIGDAHDSPHLPDKSRFRWLGCYIEERGLGRVVSVGDLATLDSFSSHTDRATFEGMAKPTFSQDLESLHESQYAFHQGLAGHKPKLDVTLGNHEHRAVRYDNLHPDGVSHAALLDEAFLQWGWRTTPYGQYRFIGGVGFVHVPLNALSRPLAQGQRANKALFDQIHGDDHRALQLTDYKTGPFRSPTVYSAATALPCGFIEGFANRGASTWRTGICEATVWGGYVRKWSIEEMVLLRRRYGRPGEGAPKTRKGYERAA